MINFSGDGTDPDDGALPASAFTWNVDFLHDGHVHPGLVLQNSKSGSFTIPSTGHDFSGNTRYRITLTVTDSAGLTNTKSVVVWPQKVNLTLRTVPAGGVIYLDGIARTTPTVYDTLVGYQHTIEARDQTIGTSDYTFDTWSDGGAEAAHDHRPGDRSDLHGDDAGGASRPRRRPSCRRTRRSRTPGRRPRCPSRATTRAGNLIVAYAIWNNAGGVSLSDSRGNAYASAGARTTGGAAGARRSSTRRTSPAGRTP